MVSGALADLSAVNLWFGVSKAGFSISKDEAAVALIEFAVPAIADLVEIWMTAAHQRKPTTRNLYDSFSIRLLRDLIAADRPDLASKQWA